MAAISTLLIAVPFFAEAQSKKEIVASYYDLINTQQTQFAHTRDSAHLEVIYKAVLTWDSILVSNAFTEILEDAVTFYNRKNDFPRTLHYLQQLVTCGKSIQMLNYLKEEKEEYTSFFNSKYGAELFDSFEEKRNVYKQNLVLAYYALNNYITAVDQFARTFLDGGGEAYFGANDYEGFSYLTPELKKKIEKTTIALADSLCFEDIITSYNEYGFPSSSKSGKGGLGFIYAHLFINCAPIYSSTGVSSVIFIDSIMKEAVWEGEVSASEYAFWKDNSTNPHSRACKNIFSTYATPHNIGGGIKKISGDILDIKNLDKRRQEIMLPPLYVTAVTDKFDLPSNYVMPKNCPPIKK